MRQYAVVYINELGQKVSLLIEALSGYCAKYLAISVHGVKAESIQYVV